MTLSVVHALVHAAAVALCSDKASSKMRYMKGGHAWAIVVSCLELTASKRTLDEAEREREKKSVQLFGDSFFFFLSLFCTNEGNFDFFVAPLLKVLLYRAGVAPSST